MKNFKQIMEELETRKDWNRSAWGRGVTEYTKELLDNLSSFIKYHGEPAKVTDDCLLNGADNWEEYSWGGYSLIYDADIAERLCSPSELKKTKNGERRPNSREQWLDTQARALYQAARRVRMLVN